MLPTPMNLETSQTAKITRRKANPFFSLPQLPAIPPPAIKSSKIHNMDIPSFPPLFIPHLPQVPKIPSTSYLIHPFFSLPQLPAIPPPQFHLRLRLLPEIPQCPQPQQSHNSTSDSPEIPPTPNSVRRKANPFMYANTMNS